MKLNIQNTLILLCIAFVCKAQTVQFNQLPVLEGARINDFVLNNQGDLLADQFFLTQAERSGEKSGMHISRDGGDSWTEVTGNLSTEKVVVHPDGSFYTIGSSNTKFHKLPYDSNAIELISTPALSNGSIQIFTIDEHGTFFAINEDNEIFSSPSDQGSWTYLTQATWPSYKKIHLYAPEGSDYIYAIDGNTSSATSGIFRFNKDGSSFELLRSLSYATIHDFFHKSDQEFALLTHRGVHRSTNGGVDWIFNSISGEINAGTWTPVGEAVISSDNGYFQSSDFGISWTQLSGALPAYSFSDHDAIEYDKLRDQLFVRQSTSETFDLHRVNRDFTTRQPVAPKKDLSSIYDIFIDSDENIYKGFLHSRDDYAAYYRSTDGGNTYQIFQVNGIDITSVEEGANGVLFVLGRNDTLYRSPDSGTTWSESIPANILFNSNLRTATTYIKAHQNGTVIASFGKSTNGRIWLSADNGINWELIDNREYHPRNIAIHPDGSIYGCYYIGNTVGNTLAKYDRIQKSWKDILTHTGTISDVYVSPIGTVIVAGADNFFNISLDNGDSFTSKYTGDINYLSFANNGYIVGNLFGNIILSKNNGITWDIIYSPLPFRDWQDLSFSKDNFIYGINEGKLFKSEKLIFNDNFIIGKVYFDEDEDCNFSSNESPFKNILITAEDQRTYYATTLVDGSYSIPVPEGDYQVKVTMPNELWQPCDSVQSVSLIGIGDSTSVDFGVKAVADCPLLNVDLTNSILRRCFENSYTVQYCNKGTKIAEDAHVEVTIDSRFTITDSEIPWSNITNSTYTFPVGNLDVFECGFFNFKFEMDCDSVILGETICAEANIFPDTICTVPNPNWSGASLDVTGECIGDSMIFIIKNVGTGDMIHAREYIVIEDVALMRVSPPFTLPAGDTTRIAIESRGQTAHVTVPQVQDHPGRSAPSATLEQCGTSFNLGLFNQFGQNDLSNTNDIECREVRGAYDPNDKQAVPAGRDTDHFIQPNSTIEYLIRFQNTGNDTAFNIFILDTLSTLLDITTLEVGAGSHNYEYEIYDNGIIRFDFKNIMLPDSNVNQIASNGFIKYKITLKSDAPIGSVIYNAADIYFDFNDPIYTNQTYHTIEVPFITVKTQEIFVKGVEVNVFPNPFTESARFELKNIGMGSKSFRLFDISGKQVYTQVFHNQQFILERKNLNSGFYFYSIMGQGTKIATGKLVIE